MKLNTENEIVIKLRSILTELIRIDGDCGGAIDLQSVIEKLKIIIFKLTFTPQ